MLPDCSEHHDRATRVVTEHDRKAGRLPVTDTCVPTGPQDHRAGGRHALRTAADFRDEVLMGDDHAALPVGADVHRALVITRGDDRRGPRGNHRPASTRR